MQWFKNLKTVTKLMLGYLVLAVLLAVTGYLGVNGMNRIDAMLVTLYERDMLGLSAAKQANVHLISAGRAVRAALAGTATTEQVENQTRLTETNLLALATELDKMEKTLITEEGRAELAKIRGLLPEYVPAIRETLRLARAGDAKGAAVEVVKARNAADKLDQSMAAISNLKEKVGERTYREAESIYAAARNLMLACVVGSVLLSIALGLFLARLIANPLVLTVGVLEKVAKGDLTQSLELKTADEVGQMASALNSAVKSMRDTLTEVSNSADSVATASQQLAAASEELSSGAQEQASSQEETSATLEELTSTVKQNAENARRASQVAAGSRESAEKGGSVVGSAVAAMGEINASSKRIADIITTIDEIAFQTNLLALNAAVEAARAGEQGRGFAVVASEVRNLAQRSATAAKEIKVLIQDSVRKVENGSELVNRSGHTLDEIVASVKEVTEIVAEIAAASQEQAAGIGQVGKAMSQMDEVTQQNSSQTEELSSTAQELAAHADQLQTLVARFTLDERHSRAAARPPVKGGGRRSAQARRPQPASDAGASHSLAGLSRATGISDAERETMPHFEEF